MAKLAKAQNIEMTNAEKMLLAEIEEEKAREAKAQKADVTVISCTENNLDFLPEDEDLLPSNEKYDHYNISLWDNFQYLSPIQQKAITLMISGEKKGEIANKLGVDRKTIYLWMQDDLFMECLKRWQHQLLIEVHEQKREIYQKALRALDGMLDNPISPELYLETVKFTLTTLKP